MGKWSGMTDYGFVIDGRITLFVSNSIDIARAGKATKDMVDYIREKQIVKNALS